MKTKRMLLNMVRMLLSLNLNLQIVNFDINIDVNRRPSVEFSQGERTCSNDNTFKIRGNVRLRSTNAASTRRARIIYLGISKGIKRVRKVISKKKSRK